MLKSLYLCATCTVLLMFPLRADSRELSAAQLADINAYDHVIERSKNHNYTSDKTMLYALGMAYDDKGNKELSEQYFRDCAKGSMPESALCAGVMHELGIDTKQDTEKAIENYTLASNGGSFDATFRLARLYEAGLGVVADYKKALTLYCKARDQGSFKAYNEIGYAYMHGLGTEKNIQKAIENYSEGASNGVRSSMFNLGLLYWKGKGVERNLLEAAKHYTEAHNAGLPEASFYLALMYYKGDGVMKDVDRAKELASYSLEKEVLHSKKFIEAISINKKPDDVLIFGVPIAKIDREMMRAMIQGEHHDVIREDLGYYCDLYDSSDIIDKTDQLSICYTEFPPVGLAKLEYRFPSTVDTSTVTKVKSMVEQKYGKPTSSKGNPDLGEVTYTWKKKDVDITVRRGWPDTTTFLTYVVPKFNSRMEKEMEDVKKARERKNMERQSSAF